jgi:mannonate dehydratase
MKQTWRWYGPQDPVPLHAASHAGAEGIVTAMHESYEGEAWTLDEVLARKHEIEAGGLEWSVVESIPVPNEIKTRSGDWKRRVEAYKASLRAVGSAGVPVVCYNFLPLVDWVRTDLRYALPNGALALRFDWPAFVAYDLFILKRPDAEASYTEADVSRARALYAAMSEGERTKLETNIIAGLPGGTTSYDRTALLEAFALYRDLSESDLRANLVEFLREVVPVAEEAGVRMCIHPDDPPIPLFGLPRITSEASDIAAILDGVPSASNGLTLCVGSLGVKAENDVLQIARRFADRIHFCHLRDVRRETDGSFYEADHLDGDSNMIAVIATLVLEEKRRREAGRDDWLIPFRPDHGHLLLDDQTKDRVYPGYSAIGRLKGLAEIRGAMRAFEQVAAGELVL